MPTHDTGTARRAEVLAAAADQFAAAGYAGSSLRQVAERAGILPGSLYHHFDSKEAIAVELVQAMAAGLVGIRRRGLRRRGDPIADLRAFVTDCAAFFARHRAALALCLLEPPGTARAGLTDLVRAQPAGVGSAIGILIGRAADAGRLRTGIDPGLLRAALRHVAVTGSVSAPDRPPTELPAAFCTLVLDGLCAPAASGTVPQTDRLTRVLADIRARWAAPETPAGRRGEILEAARIEFARRGVDATTMRDIAETAGFPAAGIYRHFASKRQIVTEIVGGFSTELLAGTDRIIDATTDPVVALDGLCGLMGLAGPRFRREYATVQVWWRTASPDDADQAMSGNRRRLQVLTAILTSGLRNGSFSSDTGIDLLALGVRELLWVPFQVTTGGTRVQDSLHTILHGGAAQPAR
ncbi:TetR/AcrR family transcriptional regulator [Nakamurella lactea]|uniref:TetR/AcrR family transcriptional regulator n=1 Tax=Nakamurella lactea TaxID=459515 RepID=UPI0004178D7D|nr:TetR/AcrR family transcriptional regulator [Nakamurella lactea]